ncbi:endonuclease [Prolixibacteraceae bacterium]|nr:endonuclease [Prolixibacteraceae bacterium]
MTRTFTLFISLLVASLSFGQIPAGYYKTADGKSGQELKLALHNIIKTHKDNGYGGLLTYYPETDARTDDPSKVLDMYSDIPNGKPKYLYSFNQSGASASSEGKGYNREHIVPQSWFGKKSPMRNDFFHVYPTDIKVNNLRGSYPHGDVKNASTTTTNGSKVGSCADEGYTGIVFEPIDEYKGDIARSYLYMSTCYNNRISSWAAKGGSVLTGKEFPSFKPWFIKVLLKWNKQDPVSKREIDRNNNVYKVQENRNPFIDHPEYVEMIWTTDEPYFTTTTTEPQSFKTGKLTIHTEFECPNGVKSMKLYWGTTKDDLSNVEIITKNDQNDYPLNVDTKWKEVFFKIELVDSKDKKTTSTINSIKNSDLLPLSLFKEEFNGSTTMTLYKNTNSKTPYIYTNTILAFNAHRGAEPADLWYVSKELDISNVINFNITTDLWTKYADSGNAQPFKILYSYDYNDGNPSENGTWTELNLNYPTANSNTWKRDIQSGNIPSKDHTKLFIAIHYVTSGTGDGETSWWQIDRLEVTGDRKASTAVTELTLASKVSILPNPATDYIQIQNNTQVAQFSKIEIYNIMGMVVKQRTLQVQDQKIELNTLKSGIYIMKLYTTKGNIIVKKLVKR